MSMVQSLTLPLSLPSDIDLVAQAKTGSGKTIAFLLPVIQTLCRRHEANARQRAALPRIGCLILSPTRELATQISVEAEKLIRFHRAPSFHVVLVFGGVPIARDVRKLAACPEKTVILVATPGRLIDHLQNTPGFSATLGSCPSLVLDEFDTLLDMGFKLNIMAILKHLPGPQLRRTLLFSATLTPAILAVAKTILKPDFQQVKCNLNSPSPSSSGIAGGLAAQASGETDEEVLLNHDIKQSSFHCPLESIFSTLREVIRSHIEDEQPKCYKVIVFFPTAKITQWAAELFNHRNALATGPSVLEIHSRKSQSYRTRVSDQFRASSRLILFSSDVSARGMDYPGVTLVVQVGIPSNREQYIHRIGRTARAGLKGEAVIILAQFEARAFPAKDLPIHPHAPLNPDRLEAAARQLKETAVLLPRALPESAYQSFLGFYTSVPFLKKCPKAEIVAIANQLVTGPMGLDRIPLINTKLARKMNLANVPGIHLAP